MAYKTLMRDATVGDCVGAAFGELEELASEMREWYDNLSEGLQQTDKAQTIESTAGTLENYSEPDVPECVAALPVKYAEMVNKDKRRGPSRDVRCQNAVAMLTAAKEAVDEWLADRRHDADGYDDANQLSSDLDEAVGEAEGCEFPGMY